MCRKRCFAGFKGCCEGMRNGMVKGGQITFEEALK